MAQTKFFYSLTASTSSISTSLANSFVFLYPGGKNHIKLQFHFVFLGLVDFTEITLEPLSGDNPPWTQCLLFLPESYE